MRKNLLTVAAAKPATPAASVGDYARRGASRSMMLSIDEMAENARKVVAGETIVELDPALVDPSFLRDRIEDDAESYAALKDSIAGQGQLQPVLARPHPESPGRYMLVFGHRRARAARDLGLPLRAVIKDIAEISHIIAQAQENSRRADLTYIERCLLARKLLEMSHSKETIRAALGVDETTLSRMTAIVAAVPAPLLDAIGAARGVGRDRWEALKKRLINPRGAAAALAQAQTPEFAALEGAARFEAAFAAARAGKGRARPGGFTLRAGDGEPLGELHASGRDVRLKLPKPEAAAFARFLQARLPGLFAEYRRDRGRG